METPKYKTALLSAPARPECTLALLFAREGLQVALAARKNRKLARSAARRCRAFACNATDSDEVERLFGLVEREIGTPDVVVYNASGRTRGAFVDLAAPMSLRRSPSARSRFLVAQQARSGCCPTNTAHPVHRRFGQRQGYAQSASFAMGKFSAARSCPEHGARIVAAGHPCRAFRHRCGIRSAVRTGAGRQPDSMLDPDAIALNYGTCCQQPRNAGPGSLELRPWVEKFSGSLAGAKTVAGRAWRAGNDASRPGHRYRHIFKTTAASASAQPRASTGAGISFAVTSMCFSKRTSLQSPGLGMKVNPDLRPSPIMTSLERSVIAEQSGAPKRGGAAFQIPEQRRTDALACQRSSIDSRIRTCRLRLEPVTASPTMVSRPSMVQPLRSR